MQVKHKQLSALFFYPPAVFPYTHTHAHTPQHSHIHSYAHRPTEASSTCWKHLARVSPPQNSPPPTQWPSETYQMAQNGELAGLPCSAGSFKLTRSPKRRSQPIIIIITVVPNSALNVVPFTHTQAHTLTLACMLGLKKKRKHLLPLQQQHMGSRKEVGGCEEKKRPLGGELVSAGSLCLWTRQTGTCTSERRLHVCK